MGFDALSHIDEAHSRSRVCRPQQCRLWKQVNCGGQCIASAIAVTTVAAVSVFQAPSTAANFTDNLRDAVVQAHGTSCRPLRTEPLVDQTAAFVAQSTDHWLNHTARVAPGRVSQLGRLEVDPLPILKDLGSNASKAIAIEGAGKTEADAIKSILITGFKAIPDCSYAAYGVSTLPNNNPDGYFLTALILAVP
jgi:hypothetical protein